MAVIDTYRNNVARKRDEVARLTEQKAKEYAKIASINTKIQGCKSRQKQPSVERCNTA